MSDSNPFTNAADSPYLPMTPDPLVAAQWASILRSLLKVGGGLVIAFGLSMPPWLSAITDSQITVFVSAAMMLTGLGMAVWGMVKSWWDTRKARAREVAAAVASAEIGVPVTVTVTPAGQPNEAVRISTTEQRAAPSVPMGTIPSLAPAL